MTTYPNSIARLVRPNAPQTSKKDDSRIAAVKRRLQANKNNAV